MPRGVGGLQALRDLGQPGMVCDHGRAPGRGRLGGHHPKRLGKDRRHHRRVGKRRQVDEMAVLERTREEHRQALRRAVPARLDRGRSRRSRREQPTSRSAVDQHLHALVLDQLAEVDDGRERPRPETPRAARRCPRRAGARWHCPGSAGRGRASASRPASASARDWGRHASMSTPGGTACTRSTGPHTSSTTCGCARSPRSPPPHRAAPRRPSADSSSLPRIEYSSSDPCASTE